jgi:hypothetical protein
VFAARSAVDADYPRPIRAMDKNAAIEAFIRYPAFKTHVTRAAFLAADG